ncbi:MAG: tetratricopeptide repeat protein, partial [Acidobacteriota bacterium]
EAELRAYMRQPTMPYIRIDLPSVDGGDDLRLREVGRAEVLARLGELLAIQDRGADATLHLRAALDLDGNQPRAHIGLGIVAERDDDLESAIEHYRRALTVDPSVAGARYLLANAQARRGDDLTTLIEDLHEVVRARPRFAAAWTLLGRAMFASDAEPATKISILTKALALSPDDTHHAERLLRLYLRQGHQAKAEQLMATHFRPRGIDPGPILDEELVSGRGGTWAVAEAEDVDVITIELPTGDSPEAVEYRTRWSQSEHLVRERRYADAAGVLEAMLETWPTDVQLHRRLDVVQRAAFALDVRKQNAELAARFRVAEEHVEQERYREAEDLLRALHRDAAEFPAWRQRIEPLIASIRAAIEARRVSD